MVGLDFPKVLEQTPAVLIHLSELLLIFDKVTPARFGNLSFDNSGQQIVVNGTCALFLQLAGGFCLPGLLWGRLDSGLSVV